jgi:lipoprotein-releasing system permease protein
MISMVVVAIGTMCLIVALSVFNGLDGLLRSMYGSFDPDIIVEPSKGKSIDYDPSLITALEEMVEVKGVTEVIEDNVLLKYKGSQRVVRMKGVSDNFIGLSEVKNSLVSGEFAFQKDSVSYAIIGRGIQYDLSVNLRNVFYSIQVFYPRNIGPGVINPQRMYQIQNIVPGGVFAFEKFYDENYIFVPIAFARNLLNYSNRVTSYEIYVTEPGKIEQVKEKINAFIDEQYVVKTGDELHADLYKILKVEKLIVFLILISIIAIASVNIFFSLTMLVIEKKKDIAVLVTQGASGKLIRSIFLFEGCIIAFTGAAIGLTIGLLISYTQQRFGLVGMGVESAVISSYPVKVILSDIIYAILAIIIITVLVSIQPSIRAAKTFSTETLQ